MRFQFKEPAMSEFKECTACNGRGEVGNILDCDTCHHCKGSGIEREMLGLPVPIGSLQELHPEFAKVLHENFLELLGDESNTVQVAKDAIEHGNDLAMVSIEGVEHVSIAHVINPFPCEELGDDFPIENHISPNCKAKDV
ncbi:hypothetical protein OZZ14_00700 [Acinetobacter baumannii]|uniref:hypothetical protein n=1 Tax=Acinetobacter baumannii TaxID=470 RepID=UPI0022864635|nr:hypothetical protein [Acinetobacter baumannii]MCZ0696047.1 hypothetical protein [Acinetobacter baumannii]